MDSLLDGNLSFMMNSLVDGIGDNIACLANASALIMQSLDNLNWAGFYLLKGEELVLGPFQGKPACIRIPLGKGVCGTAAVNDSTLTVPDVHKFMGHIACDSASNSEIVIPLHLNGKLFGVLDIDSPLFSRFSDKDRVELENCVKIIEQNLV